MFFLTSGYKDAYYQWISRWNILVRSQGGGSAHYGPGEGSPFSILHPLIKHADVLDLFTGSGAFGLEALSRGARTARMVDASRSSCITVKANLSKTGLEGGTVIQGDAVQFVKRELTAGRKYDVVFADPPYCKGPLDRDFVVELVEAGAAGLLKDEGVFIAEVQEGWGTGSEGSADFDGLRLVDTRRYGKNMLLFYRLPEK